MTVFTAVSVALATSGSAFAGLSQLSILLNEKIDTLHKTAETFSRDHSLKVKDASAPSCLDVQKRLGNVKWWYRIWKYCAILPVSALIIFSFIVAGRAAYSIGNKLEDLGAGEHLFYSWSIGIILFVSSLSLVAKLLAWWAITYDLKWMQQSIQSIVDYERRQDDPSIAPAP